MRSLLIGVLISLALPSAATAQETECAPGLAQFMTIKEGMTYQQVVAILGCEGSQRASAEMAGIRTEMYEWRGRGGFGANVNAMFQNGKMMMKSQFGLK